MKKFLIPLALAASFTFALPSPGEAHSSGIRIYLGIPHYSYRVGPDYEYRRGYGWYRPGVRRISCERARHIVRDRGYRYVRTIECRGATYTFRATRNGNRIIVYVNARSGGVWRG